LRYKSLTAFHGSVLPSLVTAPDGSPRFYSSIQEALHEAIKSGATGPFNLVTRVELIPDANWGERQAAPPPIYWTPPKRNESKDTPMGAEVQARRTLQKDLYDALLSMGSLKGHAAEIVKALPVDIKTFDDAFRWASKRG